ncbi:MAG: NAD(+)/NADH kinase [Solobacterium sp.]|nr:NAD(+)/NADH kinase [Solobacterium sp.]
MSDFAIVSRPDDVSRSLCQKTEMILKKNGYFQNENTPDFVFVIGGDGTFIYAVHKYLDHLDRARFFDIHTGTLGFYTDYRDRDYEEFIDTFLRGEVREYTYPILEGRTENGVYYGINEIRIENAAKTQNMDVYINGRLFETYRGTGMCVSTQLGSTAYNRSLGGAVIEEGLNLIEMCEMAGIHHNKYRSLKAPFVMNDTNRITFVSESFAGALLGADNEVFPMDDVHRLEIRVSPEKRVRMIKGRDISYFDRLKSLF